MYMILFSTIGSTIVYAIQGNLNIIFGLWIGFWTCVASVLGLYALDKIVKKFNRQSPLVITLTGVLALSTLLVPIFGYLELRDKINKADGDASVIWKSSPYC